MESYDYDPWGLKDPKDTLRDPFHWIPHDWQLDISGLITIVMVEWNEREITTICPECGSEAGVNDILGVKFWNCFDCFHAWEYDRLHGEKETGGWG